MRVVKCMTLKEIASDMKYSESHIRKLSIRLNKMIHTPLTQEVVRNLSRFLVEYTNLV